MHARWNKTWLGTNPFSSSPSATACLYAVDAHCAISSKLGDALVGGCIDVQGEDWNPAGWGLNAAELKVVFAKFDNNEFEPTGFSG